MNSLEEECSALMEHFRNSKKLCIEEAGACLDNADWQGALKKLIKAKSWHKDMEKIAKMLVWQK